MLTASNCVQFQMQFKMKTTLIQAVTTWAEVSSPPPRNCQTLVLLMRIPTLSLPADPLVHLAKKCRGTGQGRWTLGINPEMSSKISCCRDDSCQRLEKDKEFYGPQNWANKGVQQDVLSLISNFSTYLVYFQTRDTQ